MTIEFSHEILQRKVVDLENELTHCRRTNEEIRKKNDIHQALIQDFPLFFVAIDPDGRTLMMNETLLCALGYSSEEVLGKDYLSNFVPEADRMPLSGLLEKPVKSKAPTLNETRILTKDGRELLVEWHGRQVFRNNGKLDCFIRLGSDITERKEAEKALQASESYLRAVLDNVIDGIISINEDRLVETFNPAAERIFGYSAAEVVGQNVKMLMPEPFHNQHDSFVKNYLRTGKAKIIGIGREVQGLRKYGRIVPLDLAVSEMRVDGQRKFVGILRDITERKKVEDELREGERKLATLMANLPGMAYRCLNDPNWTIRFASDGCRQLTGYDPDDFIDNKRLSFKEIIHPDDRSPIWDQVQAALIKRQPFLLRYRIRTKSGEEKWVREQGMGIFSSEGDSLPIEGLIIDITDRMRAEEALRKLNEELEQRIAERTAQLTQANQALQESLATLKKTQDQLVFSEKMAALGELVGGVAHEINTPVGICLTVASYLELKTDEFSKRLAAADAEQTELQKYLNSVTEATAGILTNLKRAAELVKSFKQVAVDQTAEETRKFNLKEYIENVLLSLRPKYKKTPHTIEVNCPEDVEIFSYPGAFSQIITNLVMNSLIHGFEGIKEGRISIDVSVADDRLLFRYSDSGRGMPEKNVKKIYDPFFTTKRGEGGSGLGMHIVFNLVTRRLSGQIACVSAPGKGAVFTITLAHKGNLKGADQSGSRQ